MEDSICKHSFKSIIINYIKNLLNSYKGKNVIKTIISSVFTGIFGFLLATYIFKNENGVLIGIITALIMMVIIEILTNIINLKSKYFIELKNSFIFLIKGYCTNKNSIIEKIVLIILSVVGILLSIYFNNLIVLLVGIIIYLSTLKNENSLILSIIYSTINIFNKKFTNHKKIELWCFGISFASIITSIILKVWEVIV